MKHKVWYDAEAEAVRMEIQGDLSPKQAVELVHQVETTLTGKEKRYSVNDLSKSHSIKLDRKARKALKEMWVKIDIDKMAFVETTPATRMLAKVMMAMMGKAKNARFVDSCEEALAWLKEE